MMGGPPSSEMLQRAISRVVTACQSVFEDDLACVTLKGSAVKGDFIAKYSDFDFHVFLNPDVMDGDRYPQVEHAIRFQRLFGDVEPDDYGVSQFQIYFINAEQYPVDWVPPVDGTYSVVFGELPDSAVEAGDAAYMQSAEALLTNVGYSREKIVERFVDKPNTRIASIVRLLGVTLKGYMYSVATLVTATPKIALQMKLDELIRVVEEHLDTDRFRAFFGLVTHWDHVQRDHEYARAAFRKGTDALDEIKSWSCERHSA